MEALKKIQLITKVIQEKTSKNQTNTNEPKIIKKDRMDEIIDVSYSQTDIEEVAEIQNSQSGYKINKDYKILVKNTSHHDKFLSKIQPVFQYDTIFTNKKDLEKFYNIDSFNETKNKVENSDANETQRKFNKISQEAFIIPCISKEVPQLDQNGDIVYIDGIKQLIKEGGKKAIGITVPTAKMFEFDFEEVFFISGNTVEEIWGSNLTLNSDSTASQNLSKLLNWMEANSISDLHLKLFNDAVYQYTARQRTKIIKVGSGFSDVPKTNDLVNQVLIKSGRDTETNDIETRSLIVETLENGLTRNFRFHRNEMTFNLTRGHSVSIRRLPREDELKSLIELGYIAKAVKWMQLALSNRDGLIMVGGATNSGKTTLLNAFMIYLRDILKLRIHRIENPAEVSLQGIVTYDLMDRKDAKNPPTMIDFITGIMSQDPDVASVGEARTDPELEAAFKLAQTGHLALLTVHANDNAAGIARLAGAKNIKKEELNDKMRMAINQQLVLKVCPHCRKKENGILTPVDDNCEYCGGSGAEGMLPLYELTIYGELSKDDDIEDIESLVAKEKAFHISKKEILKLYDEKGWIDSSDSTILAMNRITEELKNQ